MSDPTHNRYFVMIYGNDHEAQPAINGDEEVQFYPSVEAARLAVVHAQSVTVSWTDTNSRESGTRCERSVSGGAFVPVCDVGVNVTSWRDFTVEYNKNYCFRVVAYNVTETSPYSNVSCITPKRGKRHNNP